MKIFKVIYHSLGIFIVLNVGCVGMETKRYVQDNTLYSKNYPKMRISINPEFKYIGRFNKEYEAETVDGLYTLPAKKDTYVFAQIGDRNLIKKAVFIDFRELSEGYWLPDIHANIKNKIDSSIMTINGKNYYYAVIASDNPDKDITAFLFDKGYSVSNGYLVKLLSRLVARDDTIMMHIIYVEDIYHDKEVGEFSITEWRNAIYFTDEQKTFLKDFLDRSKNNIQIRGEGVGIAKREKDGQTINEITSLDKSEKDSQIVIEGTSLAKSEKDIQTAHKEKDSDRNINYNIFQPPNYPKHRIKIHPDLKYIGEFKKGYLEEDRFLFKPPGHWSVERVTYSFCQTGDRDLIERGVFIDYRRFPGSTLGAMWSSNFSNELKKKGTLLDSTSLIINKNNYQSAVYASNSVPFDDMSTYLGDKGYTLSNIYMVRTIGRVVSAGKTLMVIFYIENIHDNENVGKYSITDWQNTILLSNSQRTFLKEFLVRSEKTFQILGETR